MIEVNALAKHFVVRRGRFRRERHVVEAVKRISFRVERGELLGYLGPNGAGKSTTIKMLTGILVPSSGHVRVAGLEPSRKRIELARRIGAMFGQRIRGELTAAMLHSPELLFLDEPTIGLDVVAKQRVRDFLVEINREDGVTVILTTHDLGDIERLCNRLLVIDHGSLIWDGGIPELKERYGGERTLVVDLEEPAPPLEVAGAVVDRVDGPRQWLRFKGSASELTARVAQTARLVDLQIAEPDIEEIVRRIYASPEEVSDTSDV